MLQFIGENEYFIASQEYGYLFDISQPSLEMKEQDLDWQIRESYDLMGTIIVGDLRVKKHETNVMESHPFPEWVVQLKIPMKKSGKMYLIIPKLSINELKKLNRREWSKRVTKTQEILNNFEQDDFLAIQYKEGISIKIASNVPHEFLSEVLPGEEIPYCQVFEPNFQAVNEIFKISTPYFNLKQNIAL